MESILIPQIVHFMICHFPLLSPKVLSKTSCLGKKTFDLTQQREGNIYPEREDSKLPDRKKKISGKTKKI